MPNCKKWRCLVPAAWMLAVCAGIGFAETATQPSTIEAPAPDRLTCTPQTFKVALDVGHTVTSPGATSARGVPEYSFNLKLGRQIEHDLREGGFTQTALLITEGTGQGQLLRRSMRANAVKPDVLLSIHHDSVQPSYLQKWTHDGTTRSYSDRFSGFSLFVARNNPHYEASLLLAKLLATELVERGLRFTLHHAENIAGERRELIDTRLGIYRYDQLALLRMSNVPAVLFEAGVIVNRAEETLLASPERQRAIGAAVRAAIVRYCDQGGQGPHR